MKTKEQIENDKKIMDFVNRLLKKPITEWSKIEINAMALLMTEATLRSKLK